MQFVDLAPRQVVEHRTEIDLALGVGTGQDGHPLFGQFTDLRRRTAREGTGGVDQPLARRREDAGVERDVELGVDDDTARLQHGVDESHVEPRVVVDHGADAGEHRPGPLAVGMAVGARGVAGDPLAQAVVERRASVERRGDLQAHPRPLAQHAGEEADVQLACTDRDRVIGFQHRHVDAGSPQPADAVSGDQRIRVLQRNHHVSQAGLDQRVAAGWGTTVVRTRLERDPGGAAAHGMACGLGRAQRRHLGVRRAGALRVSAGQQAAIGGGDDAADAGIGIGQADGFVGVAQRERPGFGGSELHALDDTRGWACGAEPATFARYLTADAARCWPGTPQRPAAGSSGGGAIGSRGCRGPDALR